ncbi:hypothetical protein EV714DRAFT_222618, partial [Schizophyllum commune]
LVRQVLREFLGIVHIKDAWLEPACSAQRLAIFRSNPMAEGPKLTEVPLRLDTSPSTLKEMHDSPWNQAIIQLLATKASQLAIDHPALRRWDLLSNVDWASQFRRRVYAILGDYRRARPVSPEETLQLVHARMESTYAQYQDSRMKRRIREWKYDVRYAVASGMAQTGRTLIQSCHDDVAKLAREQLPWWEEARRALELLTEHGMSDEEEGYEGEEPIRIVKGIKFRNPKLCNFLDTLDDVRAAETDIFPAVGRPRRRRIRVPAFSDQVPPHGLPKAFYRPGYLQEHGPFAEEELRVDQTSYEWMILDL